MTMLAPLATSAFSIRSTTDSLLTTEYLLNVAPTEPTFDVYATADPALRHVIE